MQRRHDTHARTRSCSGLPVRAQQATATTCKCNNARGHGQIENRLQVEQTSACDIGPCTPKSEPNVSGFLVFDAPHVVDVLVGKFRRPFDGFFNKADLVDQAQVPSACSAVKICPVVARARASSGSPAIRPAIRRPVSLNRAKLMSTSSCSSLRSSARSAGGKLPRGAAHQFVLVARDRIVFHLDTRPSSPDRS